MKTLIAILCLALATCQSSKNQDKTVNTQSPAYKAYMSQKHRFALNGCELTYNEKPFKIGMTLEEAVEVFGRDSILERGTIKWNKGGELFLWKNKRNIIEEYRLEISNSFNFSILINGDILESNTRMQDFIIKSSKYNFEDFIIKSSGYILKDECSFYYKFRSSVAYERIGNGHLYTRGDWKLNDTNPIEAISIYKISE